MRRSKSRTSSPRAKVSTAAKTKHQEQKNWSTSVKTDNHQQRTGIANSTNGAPPTTQENDRSAAVSVTVNTQASAWLKKHNLEVNRFMDILQEHPALLKEKPLEKLEGLITKEVRRRQKSMGSENWKVHSSSTKFSCGAIYVCGFHSGQNALLSKIAQTLLPYCYMRCNPIREDWIPTNIRTVVGRCQAFICLLSPHFLEDTACMFLLQTAVTKNIPIVAVRQQNFKLPVPLPNFEELLLKPSGGLSGGLGASYTSLSTERKLKFSHSSKMRALEEALKIAHRNAVILSGSTIGDTFIGKLMDRLSTFLGEQLDLSASKRDLRLQSTPSSSCSDSPDNLGNCNNNRKLKLHSKSSPKSIACQTDKKKAPPNLEEKQFKTPLIANMYRQSLEEDVFNIMSLTSPTLKPTTYLVFHKDGDMSHGPEKVVFPPIEPEDETEHATVEEDLFSSDSTILMQEEEALMDDKVAINRALSMASIPDSDEDSCEG